MSRAAFFGIDGGGSHTNACLLIDGQETQMTGPPLNPASVGRGESLAAWTDVLTWLVGGAGGARLVGWIGTAEVCATSVDSRARLVHEAATAAGLFGMIWLTNDLVPLLLGPPLWGNGIVLAVGTGSSVVARSARTGKVARAGGLEYVLSDEGGGYDIGLRGLRAAARAHDGRGPRTALEDHAIDSFRRSLPELGRYLSELPYPKRAVAGFAERVCQAWTQGDEAAATIVLASVREMANAAAHCAAVVEPQNPLPHVVVGGVPAGCPAYFALLEQHIRRQGGGLVHLATAPAQVSLNLAAVGGVPPVDDSGVLTVAPIALGAQE